MYTRPFRPDSFYNIYNSGNNLENIFYTKRNYEYFLNRYEEYMTGFVITYSYGLIPNQFNILIKTTADVCDTSNQLRKFFISYSSYINLQEKRTGSLFLKPFRKKPIKDTGQLLNEIFYIHSKPVLEGICNNFEDYDWNSYRNILGKSKTLICRDEVIKLFGEKENFIQFHSEMLNSEKNQWF